MRAVIRSGLAGCIAVAVAATIGLSSPVSAADMPVKARPPIAPMFSWTGFYAGVHGGYAWGESNYWFPVFGGFGSIFGVGIMAPFEGGTFRHSPQGGLFGGHLGFNHQVGNIVVGLESSLTWSGVTASSADVFSAALVFPGATYSTRLEWLATVTPRLGWTWGDGLLFIKGGLATGAVRSDLTGNAVPAGVSTSYREREHHLGWTVGAGIEYAWTPNWIVGLEYNYVDLDSEPYGGRACLDVGGSC